jgi:ABC-2 type transport system ATP-binding protein
VIIINHGRIIFDDRTSVLKRQYLTHKIVDVRFAESLNGPFELAGVTTVKQGTYGVKLEFDSREVAVESVIQQIITAKSCTDITISDPPMEEIIRDIYSA